VFSRIFVGIDREGAGDRAAVAAVRLQQRFGSEVHFVHAISMFWRSWSQAAMAAWEATKVQSLAARKQAFVQRLAATLRCHDLPMDDIEGLVEVKEGQPAELLVQKADRPTDLIALGGHRELGFLHFGATARSVLAKAHCPVWIQSHDFEMLRRVTVGVDLSPQTDTVVRAALELATRLGASLKVVHAFELPTLASGIEPYFAVDQLRKDSMAAFERIVADLRTTYPSRLEAEFSDGEPWQVLQKQSREGDVVVVGTHGHSALLRTVIGSTAYRVCKHSLHPVMVVPMPERAFRSA
jgi:nucleotide-binding universal stress UspA family protein